MNVQKVLDTRSQCTPGSCSYGRASDDAHVLDAGALFDELRQVALVVVDEPGYQDVGVEKSKDGRMTVDAEDDMTRHAD